MDDGRLAPRGRLQPDARQREVTLLGLDEVDERGRAAVDLHGELAPEHPPNVAGPDAARERDVLAADRADIGVERR